MRSRRIVLIFVSAAVCAAALAGCSTAGSGSSGGSSSGAGSSGSGGSSAATGSGTAAGATFTGDLKGTVVMNLCTDQGADSVFFLIDGDSTKYPGSVGATELGFIGPDAKAWSLDKSAGVTPVAVTSGSGGFTLDGVKVHYDLTGSPVEEITVSGTLTCP